MAPSLLLLFLLTSSLVVPSYTQNLQSTDQEDFISVLITQQAVNFAKNWAISKGTSSLLPLKLLNTKGTTKIPLLGKLTMELSNITINEIDVSSPSVELGEKGVAMSTAGTSCNLSLSWYYQYSASLLPLGISDKGTASVQVKGMQLGLTLGLKSQNGTLMLSLVDSDCSLTDFSIKLYGGASWLYQWLLDAYQKHIYAAVQKVISKKITEGILKLDSFLQALPREIPVGFDASVNVTLVKDPSLSDSSIQFDINGLFTTWFKISVPKKEFKGSKSSVFCSNSSRMFGISIDEAVLNSASALFYNANFSQWVVDTVPGINILNTAAWKLIVPSLYTKYPNADMNLNISLFSPPIIRISESDIDATVYADLKIDVLESDEVIPVFCLSLNVSGSGSVSISGNKISGSVKVNEFSLALKWSEVGNLQLPLIQPVMQTLIQTAFVPFANTFLGQGFPLPTIRGFGVNNIELNYLDSKIVVCGDVEFGQQSASAQVLRI